MKQRRYQGFLDRSEGIYQDLTVSQVSHVALHHLLNVRSGFLHGMRF